MVSRTINFKGFGCLSKIFHFNGLYYKKYDTNDERQEKYFFHYKETLNKYI